LTKTISFFYIRLMNTLKGHHAQQSPVQPVYFLPRYSFMFQQTIYKASQTVLRCGLLEITIETR